MIRSSQERKYQ